MKLSHHHSSCLFFLIVVISCFLHDNGAAAEAFSAKSSSSSVSVQKAFKRLSLKDNNDSCYTRKKHVDSHQSWRNNNHDDDSRRARITRPFLSNILPLRAGGGDDVAVEKNLLGKEMLAELIGTFLIVQIGTGSVMSAIFDNALVGLFQIAAVWAAAVTLAISTTASISGAHLNPAITVALAMFRPGGWSKVIPYCVAQLVGAILGSGVNLLLYASKIQAFETSNAIVRGTTSSIASAKAFGEYFLSPITWKTALLAEVFGTAVLSFVIFSLTNEKNDTTTKNSVFIPPIIGGTVGALICVLAPLTQAGFNPARDFGPRIIAAMAGWGTKIAFQGWWVYVLGPIVGAIIGAYTAEKMLYGSVDP